MAEARAKERGERKADEREKLAAAVKGFGISPDEPLPPHEPFGALGHPFLAPGWCTNGAPGLALHRAFSLQRSGVQPRIDFHLSQALLKKPQGELAQHLCL